MKTLLDRITKIETKLRSPGTLKRQLGRTLTAQTKRRIETEKTDPAGRPWTPWSDDYARTRTSRHSLLQSTGGLLESIKASVTKAGASVSSDKDYSSAVNKLRPFLGVSKANKAEIEELVSDWMKRSL